MEINTTIDEVSHDLKRIRKSGDTPIRVIIEESKDKNTQKTFSFLDNDFFEGEEDLTKNADQYLYERP